MTPPTTNPPHNPSDRGWIIAMVALVVVTAIIAVVVLRSTGGLDGTPVTEDTNSAKPTVSGWDEASTPPPSTEDVWVMCPRSTGYESESPQIPGWLMAGSLTVERVPGWNDAIVPYLEWAYGIERQSTVVVYGSSGWTWSDAQAVALLARQDGWQDITTSAQRSMDCLATGDNMVGYTGRTNLIDEAIDLSGRDGWHVRSELRIDHEHLPTIQGAVVDIIVADSGHPDYLEIYVSLCANGASSCTELLEEAQSSLQMS